MKEVVQGFLYPAVSIKGLSPVVRSSQRTLGSAQTVDEVAGIYQVHKTIRQMG